MREGRHQVIVVGGGFGGIRAARALAGADVGVTIVDRTNHHLFQPLLYQVATGILPDGLIAPALRSVVRKQANARGAGRRAAPGPAGPFAYRDKGSMATIGHLSAVTDSYGMKFTGVTGYTMWGFVHVLYLVGWGNRIAAILNWARALTFTKNRPHRTITAEHVRHELTGEPEHP